MQNNKYNLIIDSMEKLSAKKELYFNWYDFLKFNELSWLKKYMKMQKRVGPARG